MADAQSAKPDFTNRHVNPFDTNALVCNPILQALYRPIQGIVEKRMGFPKLLQIYAASGGDCSEVGPFCQKALAQLKTSWLLSEEDETSLRSVSGPLVIVANHPFGGADSLCLIDLMERLRPNTWKIFSNSILRNVVPLQAHRIEVDALGLTDEAKRLNRKALKTALGLLNDGGCLALFPGRRVAHFDSSLGGIVVQPGSEHAL